MAAHRNGSVSISWLCHLLEKRKPSAVSRPAEGKNPLFSMLGLCLQLHHRQPCWSSRGATIHRSCIVRSLKPLCAFVRAGKVQRKAVLLGEQGAAAAAAVVEARLAFVYQAVPPRQAYGVHQVLPPIP